MTDDPGTWASVPREVADACETEAQNIVNLFGGPDPVPALKQAIFAALLRAHAPPKPVRIAMAEAKEATRQ